jgi:hypothetical protein
VIPDKTSVRMEVLWLPGITNEFYPLTIKGFTDTIPRDLCHTLPHEKLQA